MFTVKEEKYIIRYEWCIWVCATSKCWRLNQTITHKQHIPYPWVPTWRNTKTGESISTITLWNKTMDNRQECIDNWEPRWRCWLSRRAIGGACDHARDPVAEPSLGDVTLTAGLSSSVEDECHCPRSSRARANRCKDRTERAPGRWVAAGWNATAADGDGHDGNRTAGWHDDDGKTTTDDNVTYEKIFDGGRADERTEMVRDDKRSHRFSACVRVRKRSSAGASRRARTDVYTLCRRRRHGMGSLWISICSVMPLPTARRPSAHPDVPFLFSPHRVICALSSLSLDTMIVDVPTYPFRCSTRAVTVAQCSPRLNGQRTCVVVGTW